MYEKLLRNAPVQLAQSRYLVPSVERISPETKRSTATAVVVSPPPAQNNILIKQTRKPSNKYIIN